MVNASIVADAPGIEILQAEMHGVCNARTESDVSMLMENPIDIILNDHRNAEKLFKEYEDLDKEAYETKQKILRRLSRDLKLHMEMEERLFYPMVEKAFGEEGNLVEEGIAEHDVAKRLIEELSITHAEDPQFDARMKVLSEAVAHHILEEEEELLPKAEEKVGPEDLASMGEEMSRFRHEHGDYH
jgi:hemerythrin-like domain-containing protein